MKIQIKQVLFLCLLISLTIISASAQSNNDNEAIKSCLNNSLSRDWRRIEMAFLSSASIQYIDAQTGEFKNMPIPEFIAKVKVSLIADERKISIESVNIEGKAAQAKVKTEVDNTILFDYMNLLKINGEWKIVSRIYSSQRK